MRTKQQIFDIVANHLLTIPKPSQEGNGQCKYRSSDGLKCAVGILIPDEDYDPDMEGLAISSLVEEFPEIMKIIPEIAELDFERLLEELQDAHDTDHFWKNNKEGLKTELARIAQVHNLHFYQTT